MRFTLIYDGPLSSTSRDSRLAEKQHIRRQVHWQLAELYKTEIALRDHWPVKRWRESPPEILVCPKGQFTFIPLVTRAAHLLCELDILFLVGMASSIGCNRDLQHACSDGISVR